MVGCMVTGSVGMAPGMVLAQICEVVDLDGPLLQAEDWANPISVRSHRRHVVADAGAAGLTRFDFRAGCSLTAKR